MLVNYTINHLLFLLHARTVWTNAGTKLLIDIVHTNMYDDNDEKVICHNGMWQRVKYIMHVNGYDFTNDQLRGRWKTVVYSYKRVKDSNKTSGQLHRKHEFHAELSFLDKSVDVVPLVVVQSSQVPHAHSSSDEQNNLTPRKATKKEKTVKLNVMQHLQEMASSFQREQLQTRIQRERHHLEKFAMMEKLIETLNKRE